MRSILEYLEASAKSYPDKPAFADETDSCSFSELKSAAQAAGSSLARAGVVRRPVPVLMEKSVQTIKILMGIVYAGGFYVVLDASHPVRRLQQILHTLDANVLIVPKEHREKAKELGFSGQLLDPKALLMEKPDLPLLKSIRAQQCDVDPLYVLFTSGSTGVPKGVLVSHRSVIDFIDAFTSLFGITDTDVLGNQAPWDFDVSVKDIYTGLKTGALVQIIPRGFFSAPKKLLDLLEDRKVTNLTWAVSALCIISTLNGFSYKVPSRLRRVLFSGEAMPIKHLNYWRKYLPDALFVNLYGPTEITCNCTYYILDRAFSPGDVLPIGKAFPNEKVLLLDEEDHEILKPGQIGEICVCGTALALGYYRDPAQTQKAFVQNPLNRDYPELIYRTGDLGAYNGRGELCFTSRRDHQIKHMGHRIELGEIECALEKADGLVRACCFFDRERNKIVCCYQGNVDKRDLSRGLAKFLPMYMVPNLFYQLEAMPLNKNGKIDRQALLSDYRQGKI